VSRAPQVARDTRKDAYESSLRLGTAAPCRTKEVVHLSQTVLATRHTPHPSINLEAITTHLTALTDAQACPQCDHATTAVVADFTHLLTELARLHDELAAARLEAANLRTAIHATLGAVSDGEADPLAYLRWEVSPEQTPSSGPGRGCV
jgi:hypothetical protein